VLTCPFCGAAETDRFDLEGRRFLVFACTFSPAVDPRLGERELEEHLAQTYRRDAAGTYFRGTCDRLHLYVTRGGAAEELRSRGRPGPAAP
jgi:hypothetical protein